MLPVRVSAKPFLPRLPLSGPHLIFVPKSTLQARKFQQRMPDDMNVIILTGTKDKRADIIVNRLIPQDFEVCITSYEICLIKKSTFKKFSFKYTVIDDMHHIKNVNSILSQSFAPLSLVGVSSLLECRCRTV
jgi:SWI/SNF-related matrix-associated actin-dependent regulator of chromatin subfamily A member 5